MKFTKEDARKELVAKIPNEGQTLNLSERSINEQLDTLMPLLANDETELDAFVTSVLPVFKTADGNVRNDVSVGIKAYQDQHPSVQPKKKEEEKVVVANPKTNDPSAELLKRIEELERKNADNERKSTLSQRRSNIISKMNEKGCKDSEWINELLSDINLEEEDFDLDKRVDKYIKLYNKSEAKGPKDVTPKAPKGNGGDSYLNEIIKAAGELNKNANALRQ